MIHFFSSKMESNGDEGYGGVERRVGSGGGGDEWGRGLFLEVGEREEVGEGEVVEKSLSISCTETGGSVAESSALVV
jgi:hypothetical protein